MRITLTLGARSDGQVRVYRPADDPFSPHYGDRRRHLVISAPYQMAAVQILAAISDECDDVELAEVASALGLPGALQPAAEPSRPVLCAHAGGQGHGMHWLQPGERCPPDHAGGAS